MLLTCLTREEAGWQFLLIQVDMRSVGVPKPCLFWMEEGDKDTPVLVNHC